MKYMSLATQMMASLGAGVFIGLKLDNKFNTKPLLTTILPLLVLVGIFYKIFKDAQKSK